MSNEFNALGIPPKERAQKMRNAVTAEAAVLMEQGRFTEARRCLTRLLLTTCMVMQSCLVLRRKERTCTTKTLLKD